MKSLRFLHIAANTRLNLPCMNVAIGSAEPGEAVSFKCNGIKYECTADKKGLFRIALKENPNDMKVLSFS